LLVRHGVDLIVWLDELTPQVWSSQALKWLVNT
jgi:hypothetical protein